MKIKKITATFLVTALALGSLTVPAAADTTITTDQKDETTGLWYKINGENAEIIQHGYGEYTVAGEFTVPDTLGGKTVTSLDWRVIAYNPNVTKVTINENVTEITNFGIDDGRSTKLAEIVVDSNNTAYCTIDNVLYSKDKTKLIKAAPTKTTVTIEPTVTEICHRAFCGSQISAVTIPSSVTTIGQYVFDGCKNLTSINIPASVTSINDAIAPNSGVSEITVADGNTAVKIVDGALFTADGTKLLQYPPKKAPADFIIPEGTTTLMSQAFAGASVNKLTLPVSITGFHASLLENFEELGSIAYAGTTEQWESIIFSTGDYNGAFSAHDIKCSDGTVYGFNVGGQRQPTEADAAANGVQCDFDADTFSVDVELKREAKSLSDTLFSVDISFVDESGNKVQPTKPVTVRIPVPQSMNGQTIYVYHKDDNGNTEKVESSVKTVEGVDYVEFSASSFSEYTLSTTVLETSSDPFYPIGGDLVPNIRPVAPTTNTATANTATTSDNSTEAVVTTAVEITTEALETTAAQSSTSENKPVEDKNQATGVMIAIIPAVLAAAGVVVSKKRR